VRRIARELGVQYVVEGSVRKTGTNLRVTAQLIDAMTGNHLWAERYDRASEDIFKVQDEMVHTIVATLEGRLAATVAELARRKPTRHLAAYDCVLQARAYLSTHDAASAKPLLLRAIELDPAYAQAYAWLADTVLRDFFFDSQAELLDQAVIYGRKAIVLDENDGICHWGLAGALLFKREFEEAGAHYERAVALNPSDMLIVASYCHWLSRVGRVDEALRGLDEVLLRDPFPPGWIFEIQSIALMQAKRYEDAIRCMRRMPKLHPWNHAGLAGCYAQLGRMSEARAHAAETLKLMPDFTIAWELLQEPFKNPADTELLVESQRKAGLPE
jgi:adenylate cyclase